MITLLPPAALLVAWLASGWLSLGLRHHTTNEAREIAIQSGCLVISQTHFPGITPAPWHPTARWNRAPQWTWAPTRIDGMHLEATYYPLWLALLPACAPALWFIYRARRRAARGLCPSCAYNRAGLAPDAPCPECGSQQMRQRTTSPPGSPNHQ